MTMRRTFQRQVILEELQATKSHPRAGDIYQKVKERIPTISFGTVYRNLRLLREQGQIQELPLGDQASRWDGNPQPHDHFTCERCGLVLDLPVDYDAQWNELVARETGLAVTRHRTEFYGLCRSCQAQSLQVGTA